MLNGITTRTSARQQGAEHGLAEAPGRSWVTSPAPSAWPVARRRWHLSLAGLFGTR